MRTLRIQDYGGTLQAEEIPDPVAGPKQAVVRSLATS